MRSSCQKRHIMNEYDIAIIGAGVVGSAFAYSATKIFPGRSVAVFEKKTDSGLETSARNSGVLHSGFHQAPRSLKARFAKTGHILARKFAEENGVPLLPCGMLIAIPSLGIRHLSLWCEGSVSMWHLFRRGKSHDIKFDILTNIGIKKYEPNICAMAGVFIPSVSVIDSKKFVKALACSAISNGAHFYYRNKVRDIQLEKDHTLIVTTYREIHARVVINAAGLYADEIGNLALKKQHYRQYPWRGEYYEVINPEKRDLVKRLVYPVVRSSHPGKGIHFSPRPDGRLFLGPNARGIPSKTFYEEDCTPKGEFLNVAKAFGVRLGSEDIEWSYSGIRPKLSNTPKEDDFLISVDSHVPVFINLMGIESPGLSSAMELAKYTLTREPVREILR